MSKQYCDQCHNHCPEDALQCDKGRRHFGLEPVRGAAEHPAQVETDAGVLGLLRLCGHMLHHGGAGTPDLLAALDDQEQQELERLLGKLTEDWKTRMNAVGQPHSHGRHK